MSIDWNHFTPYSALGGGALIGSAAGMLLLLNGRIAGISGIVGGLFVRLTADSSWRVAFIAGLFLAPWGWRLFAPLPPFVVATPPLMLMLAGLLVGLGSRFGAGCTSGHGVCGLARFSLRSLVATLCFMGAGFATVFLVRHMWG